MSRLGKTRKHPGKKSRRTRRRVGGKIPSVGDNFVPLSTMDANFVYNGVRILSRETSPDHYLLTDDLELVKMDNIADYQFQQEFEKMPNLDQYTTQIDGLSVPVPLDKELYDMSNFEGILMGIYHILPPEKQSAFKTFVKTNLPFNFNNELAYIGTGLSHHPTLFTKYLFFNRYREFLGILYKEYNGANEKEKNTQMEYDILRAFGLPEMPEFNAKFLVKKCASMKPEHCLYNEYIGEYGNILQRFVNSCDFIDVYSDFVKSGDMEKLVAKHKQKNTQLVTKDIYGKYMQVEIGRIWKLRTNFVEFVDRLLDGYMDIYGVLPSTRLCMIYLYQHMGQRVIFSGKQNNLYPVSATNIVRNLLPDIDIKMVPIIEQDYPIWVSYSMNYNGIPFSGCAEHATLEIIKELCYNRQTRKFDTQYLPTTCRPELIQFIEAYSNPLAYGMAPLHNPELLARFLNMVENLDNPALYIRTTGRPKYELLPEKIAHLLCYLFGLIELNEIIPSADVNSKLEETLRANPSLENAKVEDGLITLKRVTIKIDPGAHAAVNNNSFKIDPRYITVELEIDGNILRPATSGKIVDFNKMYMDVKEVASEYYTGAQLNNILSAEFGIHSNILNYPYYKVNSADDPSTYLTNREPEIIMRYVNQQLLPNLLRNQITPTNIVKYICIQVLKMGITDKTKTAIFNIIGSIHDMNVNFYIYVLELYLPCKYYEQFIDFYVTPTLDILNRMVTTMINLKEDNRISTKTNNKLYNNISQINNVIQVVKKYLSVTAYGNKLRSTDEFMSNAIGHNKYRIFDLALVMPSLILLSKLPKGVYGDELMHTENIHLFGGNSMLLYLLYAIELFNPELLHYSGFYDKVAIKLGDYVVANANTAILNEPVVNYPFPETTPLHYMAYARISGYFYIDISLYFFKDANGLYPYELGGRNATENDMTFLANILLEAIRQYTLAKIDKPKLIGIIRRVKEVCGDINTENIQYEIEYTQRGSEYIINNSYKIDQSIIDLLTEFRFIRNK